MFENGVKPRSGFKRWAAETKRGGTPGFNLLVHRRLNMAVITFHYKRLIDTDIPDQP